MFAGKKGDMLSHWVIIELVLLGVVLVYFFIFVKDVRADTRFQKVYLVQDIGLFLEKLQSVPGKVHYQYFQEHVPLSSYTFSFDNSVIALSEPDNPAANVVFPFFSNDQLLLDLPLQQQDSFYFLKTINRLSLRDREQVLTSGSAAVCQDVSNVSSHAQESPSPFFSHQPVTLVLIADGPEAHLVAGFLAQKLDDSRFNLKTIITKQDDLGYDLSKLDVHDDLVLEISIVHDEMRVGDFLDVSYGVASDVQRPVDFSCFLSSSFFLHSLQPSQSSLLIKNPNGIALHLQFMLHGRTALTPTMIADQLAESLTKSLQR